MEEIAVVVLKTKVPIKTFQGHFFEGNKGDSLYEVKYGNLFDTFRILIWHTNKNIIEELSWNVSPFFVKIKPKLNLLKTIIIKNFKTTKSYNIGLVEGSINL